MKYVCKNKCYYRSRLWVPGETMILAEGEKLPPHFVKKGEEKLPKLKGEPKTMKELHDASGAPPASKPSGPVEEVKELFE